MGKPDQPRFTILPAAIDLALSWVLRSKVKVKLEVPNASGMRITIFDYITGGIEMDGVVPELGN